ncbi:MAG: hypothetical protein AMXMBFR48_20070 [Ignavibacteriales bacterium]
MISKEELERILPGGEQFQIEKTISLTDKEKFGEAICAFSNDFPASGKPGYLIVGVHDDGRIAGIHENENILQTLMDFRNDGRVVPPPFINVQGFSFPDGYVAVAEVLPGKQPPFRYKGKVYIRLGPRSSVASEAEERILSEKRSSFASSFDSLPCYGSTLNDLSMEIFKFTYLPNAIDSETLLENGRNEKQQLASLKFYDLKADCPTNAAILMFGSNPLLYLPGGYVQYIRFEGRDVTSDFIYEKRFSGDLTTQMRQMDEFIKANIIRKTLHEIGGQHSYNYPVSAIKELLYNAVIHRDYQSHAPVKFYEFDDRIEISNAGGLYGKARPENFPNENDYRNPTIAEAAYTLGYVNKFNVGIKRAKAALERHGNPEPVFSYNELTTFSVTIFGKNK